MDAGIHESGSRELTEFYFRTKAGVYPCSPFLLYVEPQDHLYPGRELPLQSGAMTQAIIAHYPRPTAPRQGIRLPNICPTSPAQRAGRRSPA